MDNGALLEMKGISKRFYGVQALDKVDFTVQHGEVHALIGENGAGKSTLMKIALGLHKADGGDVFFRGRLANYRSAAEALRAGISMIHQEISLVPTLDVAENIWLGQERKFAKAKFIDAKKRRSMTEELLASLHIELDPSAEVSTLTVAQMQLVEVARAVSYNAELIIMDEPTSALSEAEIENLYRIIRHLSAGGTTVVFISHKLEELYEICQRFTIMRDGRVVAVRQTKGLPMDELIALIAGRKLASVYPERQHSPGGTVLECRGLHTAQGVRDVSFCLKKGEILGFCGLMGSGRTEIMRAIYGMDKLTAGEVWLEGKKLLVKSPKYAVRSGIAMITEDRLRSGSIHVLPVLYNLTASVLYKLCTKLGFIRGRQERQSAAGYVEKMNIKIGSLKQPIADLSGGNQQKAIIGRALMTQPDILIMDEPTRGVDVGAKAEIHTIISELAASGVSILLVSSELPEVLGMSDRILVVRAGTIAAEYDAKQATQEALMYAAFGVEDEGAKATETL